MHPETTYECFVPNRAVKSAKLCKNYYSIDVESHCNNDEWCILGEIGFDNCKLFKGTYTHWGIYYNRPR